jgi:glycosyltransferase involved in cell wall biosynthesis
VPSVLEVCDYHGPYPGNFIPSLIAVGERVRRDLGLDYAAVFPDAVAHRPWTRLVRDAGIEALYLPAAEHGVRGVRTLARIASRRQSVLLRSHFTAWDLDTLAAGRLLRAGVVWNVHTGNLDTGARRQAADLVKARGLGRLVDRIVGVSDEIGADLHRRGFPADRIDVVPNGLDLARFDALPDRHAARGTLDLAPDDLAILAFCWTPYRKGADLIIDAALELDRTDFVVHLVGRDELRDYIAERFGSAPPAWLRVLEPVDDPRALFVAADVFVSASREEAFGYAIGEAMASGVPVLSSDIPGPTAYFAAEGVTTFISEDVGALRSGLAWALDHPPERAALAQANRAFLEASLGLDRHVDRVIHVFSDVLAKRGHGKRRRLMKEASFSERI